MSGVWRSGSTVLPELRLFYLRHIASLAGWLMRNSGPSTYSSGMNMLFFTQAGLDLPMYSAPRLRGWR